MALPTSRNKTYAAGSQVDEDDLNDLQDWIVKVRMPILAPVGSKILGWTGFVRDTASQVDGRLRKSLQPSSTASTPIGTQIFSAGTTSDQTLSHTLATAETVVASTIYWVQFNLPAATMRVFGGSYTLGL